MGSAKAKHLKTCPHCAFLQASAKRWKNRGAKEAKADMIRSARKVVGTMFSIMSPEEQTEFIKEISQPMPNPLTILEAIKTAMEQTLGAKVKVTEH